MLKELNNFIFISHFYFIAIFEISEKYKFLLNYINFKKFQFIILLVAIYIIYIIIINLNIIYCAFKLFHFIKIKY